MVSSSIDWDTNWAFTERIAIVKIQKTEDVTRIFMILFNEIRHPQVKACQVWQVLSNTVVYKGNQSLLFFLVGHNYNLCKRSINKK